MKLSDLFSQECFVSELRCASRDEVIKELVALLLKSGRLKVQDSESIIQALVEREGNGSTGFGKGVAVPHCQHPAIEKTLLAVGRSSVGLEFGSLDHAPVYSVFLLLSPANDHDRHLQAMELIFRNLQNAGFRKSLRQANTSEAVGELFEKADQTAQAQ